MINWEMLCWIQYMLQPRPCVLFKSRRIGERLRKQLQESLLQWSGLVQENLVHRANESLGLGVSKRFCPISAFHPESWTHRYPSLFLSPRSFKLQMFSALSECGFPNLAESARADQGDPISAQRSQVRSDGISTST